MLTYISNAGFVLFFSVSIALLYYFLKSTDISRRSARWLGVAWIAATTAEFWAFGPYSFIAMGDEGNLVYPLLSYLGSNVIGGNFSHPVMGGSASKIMMAKGAAFFDLEKFLFENFPPWIALAVHKVSYMVVAYAGSYNLLRKFHGAPRLGAASLAAIGTLSVDFFFRSSLWFGLSLGLIPLTLYLLARTERRGGLSGLLPLLGVAGLQAISSIAGHSAFPVAGAIFLYPFLGRPRLLPMALLTIAAIGLLSAINWYGWITELWSFLDYSTKTNADWTARFTGFLDHFREATSWGFTGFFTTVLSLFAVATLAVLRPVQALIGAMVLAFCVSIGPVLDNFPWQDFGLETLNAIRFHRVGWAFNFLALIVGAQALSAVAKRPGGRAKYLSLVLCGALAVGVFGYEKAKNAVFFLDDGGQSVHGKIGNLRQRPWASGEHFRVVSLPFDFPPTAALSYGLRTFDGYQGMSTRTLNAYWTRIRRVGPHADTPIAAFPVTEAKYSITRRRPGDTAALDYKSLAEIAFDQYSDSRLLRVANVRYVLSYLPLVSPNLRQIDGPTEYQVPRQMPLPQWLLSRLHFIFAPPDIRVYDLGEPLPIAYFGRAVHGVSPAADVEESYRLVKELALDRTIVAAEADAGLLRNAVQAAARVIGTREVANGYDIDVEAPAGGVLVLNSPYLPFWKATADGKPLRVRPVNKIHMAVSVPRVAGKIEFRYSPGRQPHSE